MVERSLREAGRARMKEETTDMVRTSDRRVSRPRRWLVASGLLLVAALTTLTASPALMQSPEPEAPAPGGILHYAIAQPVDSLDPAVGTTSSTSVVIQSIFDRLVWARPGDPTYYPGLAESWEVNDDRTSYTFHLRDDVTFHDGTPFNAEAVKFNFDRIVDPETMGGISVGSLGPYESSTVIDEYTIQVDFSKPNASLLNMLQTVWLAPVSPAAVAQYGADFQDHLIGTGPYMLKEHVRGDHITLVRNPDYAWAPEIFQHQGPGYLDEIRYRIIQVDSTRVAALEAGEENLIDRVPAPDFERFQSDQAYQTMVASTGGTGWFLGQNLVNPPTDDPAVRSAIASAVNPEVISDTIFKGTLPPLGSILEHNTLGYMPTQDDIITYDPSAAAATLDEAGWTVGPDGIRQKDGVPLHVVVFAFTGFGMDEMSIALQGQLREVGIDVEIRNLEFGAGVTAMGAQNEHNLSWVFGWYADPSILDVFFRCEPAVFNYTFTCDPAIDQLLDEGLGAPNDEARAGIYDEVVTTLMQNGTAVPFFAKSTVLVGDQSIDLADIFVNPEGYPIFYDVHIR
jgi:peptide/nickel transport system substrate-binding protein